ncbi:mannose-1-phosphate guanylyltransferase/mannose-6-phosphate isomerase [Pontibacter sp. JAM-7]|uniref:mannose-1-phosphate guanylyltransferase/mannose-6-phosphate isomerase n=1 Tax=Pontibacter sp. JAM-7 TaxID=3366581 RepID=UPI003AF7C387
MLIPVVMAGGTGSRLWPLSRELNPKQFLKLAEDQTMLQATLNRLEGLDCAAPIVICNEQHRFLAAEQLRQSDEAHSATILLEPCGRNTAPAIALAALQAMRKGDDPVLLVLAADHLIEDVDAFHAAINSALLAAESGRLITFGIVPTQPETGYGYIQRGDKVANSLWEIARFVEKPDRETAREYVRSQDYYWNSGMFVFKASAYVKALSEFAPDILKHSERALELSVNDLDFVRLDSNAFAQCPDVSIDYAVMEHSQNGAVIPLDAGWSDIGSWSTLWEVSPKDSSGNHFKGDVIAIDCKDTLVRAESRLVTVLGVEDLVVVEDKDTVLVAHKEHVQNVKSVVNILKKQSRQEAINHCEVYRPWGRYEAVDTGKRYQVKRITVKPGGRLSLQMHHHRAEHWIVVSGTARVTVGDQSEMLTENQSTYIPIGAVHRLENPGKVPLELIEVQSGSYLGEDDIVRLDDQYGRD